MYYCYRKSLFHLKGCMRTSPIPRLCALVQHSPSTVAPKYTTATATTTTTTTSEKQSFRVNYLVDNCGFSPETALEASKQASFFKSAKPDSVLELFRNLNFSDSQLHDVIKKAPWLLSCDPVKTISPKLEFLKSKGASNSVLSYIVITNPWFLQKSLQNNIIPIYDLMKRFLHSDKRTIVSVKRCISLITDYRLPHNVKLLLDNGVPHTSIALLLRHWPLITNFRTDELKRKFNEVKEMGFNPSKSSFVQALRVKLGISRSSWERKAELYGRWGWSNEVFHKAFAKRPLLVVTSDHKIEAVMKFFVNHMGWDSLVLAKHPILLNLCLEKRIIPRASVLQFLLSRGLIKNISCTPFIITEEMFLRKFVNGFKDKTPQLLKLYEEQLNLPR